MMLLNDSYIAESDDNVTTNIWVSRGLKDLEEKMVMLITKL
jgi:hypothetical protein